MAQNRDNNTRQICYLQTWHAPVKLSKQSHPENGTILRRMTRVIFVFLQIIGIISNTKNYSLYVIISTNKTKHLPYTLPNVQSRARQTSHRCVVIKSDFVVVKLAAHQIVTKLFRNMSKAYPRHLSKRVARNCEPVALQPSPGSHHSCSKSAVTLHSMTRLYIRTRGATSTGLADQGLADT